MRALGLHTSLKIPGILLQLPNMYLVHACQMLSVSVSLHPLPTLLPFPTSLLSHLPFLPPVSLFKITVLLKNNSHTIKINPFKVYNDF